MKNLFGFLLAAILLPFSLSLSGQDFKQGYIVEPGGDTNKVLIHYQNRISTPEQIKVKQSPDAGIVTLGAEDISGFGVAGDVFIKATVEHDTRLREVNDLDHNKDPKLVTDTVFLQLLVEGEKSLYLYRDRQRQDNFYIRQDDRPVLLVYTKYLYEDETATYQRENQTYKGQLINYMKDCRAVFEQINKADYQTSSLLSVFDYYYVNCAEPDVPEYVFDKNKLKLKFRYGLFAGYSMSKIHFTGQPVQNYYLVESDFPISNDYVLGGFIEMVFPWGKGKLTFNNEIEFTRFKTSAYYIDYRSEAQQYEYSTDFHFNVMRVNSMLRYLIPIRNLNFYVNAGLSNQFLAEKQNQTYFVKTITGNEYGHWQTGVDTESYAMGLIAGMGLRYSGVFAEFKYQTTDQLTRIMNLEFSWNQYTFTLGYMFNH